LAPDKVTGLSGAIEMAASFALSPYTTR
jgi:hypothetical protein